MVKTSSFTWSILPSFFQSPGYDSQLIWRLLSPITPLLPCWWGSHEVFSFLLFHISDFKNLTIRGLPSSVIQLEVRVKRQLFQKNQLISALESRMWYASDEFKITRCLNGPASLNNSNRNSSNITSLMMSFEYVTTSLVQPRTVLESVKITSQETITLPPCTLFILSTHLYKLPIIFPYLHHKPIYSL